MKAKGESGKHICTSLPCVYLKDKNEKNKWIVDDVATDVLKEIFRLCVNGYGLSQIANALCCLNGIHLAVSGVKFVKFNKHKVINLLTHICYCILEQKTHRRSGAQNKQAINFTKLLALFALDDFWSVFSANAFWSNHNLCDIQI